MTVAINSVNKSAAKVTIAADPAKVGAGYNGTRG